MKEWDVPQVQVKEPQSCDDTICNAEIQMVSVGFLCRKLKCCWRYEAPRTLLLHIVHKRAEPSEGGCEEKAQLFVPNWQFPKVSTPDAAMNGPHLFTPTQIAIQPWNSSARCSKPCLRYFSSATSSSFLNARKP